MNPTEKLQGWRVIADPGKCAHLNLVEDHNDPDRPGNVVLRCLDCDSLVTRTRTTLPDEVAISEGVARQLLQHRTGERFRAILNPPKYLNILRSTELPERPPKVWTVADILYKGAIVLLSAQTGIGKSTLMQNLAAAMVNGNRDFLGYAVVPQERGVLYINFDEPQDSFEEHARMLGVNDRLLIAHREDVSLDLALPEHVERLAEQCVQHNIGTVIFDSWGAVFSGEQNSTSEVKAAMNNVGALRYSADLDHTILLHHTGWDNKDRPRGAGSILENVDIRWNYTQKNEDSPRYFNAEKRLKRTPKIEVCHDWDSWTVTRGGPDVPGSVLGNRLAERFAEVANHDESRKRRVVAALQDSPEGLGWEALREVVGSKAKPLHVAVDALVAEGVVTFKKEGRALKHYLAEAEAPLYGQAEAQA